MNPSACPAVRLPEVDRINLAARHDVSRKYVYRQANKASAALDEVFTSSAPDDAVLFALPVTKIWLRQLTLSLTLICHSSYRGVVEWMRDLLGVRISEGTIHNVHQAAARQAGAINRSVDLSPMRAACTTTSSRAPSPCSPVSTPG